MRFLPFLFLIAVSLAAENLEIHVLKVQFKEENPDNSLTTGRGHFADSTKTDAYWERHINFAKNYFEKASGGKVNIYPRIYPEIYTLDSSMISYNRTSRKKGEKMEEFDSVRTADYARFVNDVLRKAKEDIRPANSGKRVILIAHAGHSRLIDGGTMGTRGANTPGDFIDAYIDTSWGDFWRGFEVSTTDSIKSVIVTSETAEQDGLNWGIEGTITSQIGRELGLPYTFDVVKGFSRLGYFDGMDFAGYNAGNGFFPSLPSAWLRIKAGWDKPFELGVGKDTAISICSVSCAELCGASPQIVKVPINSNEYILLENRQRMCEGKASIDTALPASGIVAWHINEWFIKAMLDSSFGAAVNAWGGDTFRDHQFGIALIEADGVLGLGKEFKAANGESDFDFGSGSDLIPHKRFKSKDTVFSISPAGYANTASTFGGYSGIEITARLPANSTKEGSYNRFTGDSVTTWQALNIPIKIEWIGELVKPISMENLPAKEEFPECQESPKPPYLNKSYDLGKETFCPLNEGINKETIFLGNNRLYIVDSNGIPLPKFPSILSNGEPLTNFHSKPLSIDIDGDGSREILVPTNNGLILAVNSDGKLLQGEFPIAAGTFFYEKDIHTIPPPMKLLTKQSNDSIYLFALHRDSIKAFYLPKAKEFQGGAKSPTYKDEISEFFIYPNPIRTGKASMRFRIENYATSATLEIFDITGFRVFKRDFSNVNYGSNQIEGMDFSNLGSDIYSARLTVKFESGKRKEKWMRIGVIRGR